MSKATIDPLCTLRKAGPNDRVATALRGFKAEAKLPVRVLHERTNISTATINRILNGELDIRVVHMAALAEALGVTPMQVMQRSECL
ncbi:helix-turn-helix domain-containing protein [Frigoribacterium sp. RIT-PI-h]|uniref:helix-turn-helix domain-containing protein n=1 Tax=Frigoribacterium sp. RIT-PI-h TaxID=1690245 RepID=UPI00137931D5|nr:helix-turn-helix transcriptional regulator [Frigoribacterium sp. RIT-PI-h]